MPWIAQMDSQKSHKQFSNKSNGTKRLRNKQQQFFLKFKYPMFTLK